MSGQNIFDNPDFFREYSALRSKDDNYNILLEQPVMTELLPPLRGKTVLDLGCGCGYNCVDFIERGAARVVGIDISQKMLKAAESESSDEHIEYKNMSMTDISSLNETFDFIYSSLAFHYIEDFGKLIQDIHRLLAQGGQLLFSQEHPIMTATIDGKGHFNRDENGDYNSYTFSNYSEPGKRETFWYIDGVVKYHRTLGEILTAIAEAGFMIEKVAEPVPNGRALEKRPSLVKEWIKPTFLIVKARKL